MPTFRIVKPCAYVADGAVCRYNRAAVGAEVDLPDDVAVELGDAVSPVGGDPAKRSHKKKGAAPESGLGDDSDGISVAPALGVNFVEGYDGPPGSTDG